MIGTTIHERYRIDAELGRGGMGAIYQAYDLLLLRHVAVKVLLDSGLGAQGRARLLHEAQAVAHLNHPNIVSVYDAGEIDGNPFIVMELVQGKNLHEYGALSIPQVIEAAHQLCAALDHAHSQGIIHRDIKPENVIVVDQMGDWPGQKLRVKLMDFGQAHSQSATRLTEQGALVGTAYYIAPEQALGKEIDQRADLYSLGVLLYELAARKLPFLGNDLLAVLGQHLQTPPAPPSNVNPEIPPALEAVILKLLAKDPAERFESAPQVSQALESLQPAEVRETPESLRFSAPATHANNLPVALTSFIGRQGGIAQVKHLLAGGDGKPAQPNRLVTLIGAGGCGKTRLALQVVGEVLSDYPQGVWFGELAPLTNPNMILQAVLQAFEFGPIGQRTPWQALGDYLRSRRLLLVLDNCEHLIEACAELAENLLRSCGQITLLATSREALGVPGEAVFYVPSLSTPEAGQLLAEEDALQYEALQLFVERAASAMPGFALTEKNIPTVAQICRRLDGIPLAIELAAARLKVLSVEQIAARLDDCFHLLTGGSRTALPRHQTLRATIDWSYGLLQEPERILLHRLTIFSGGWTLEAAETVCPGDGLEKADILDLLSGLVNKSLVTAAPAPNGVMRYAMLETIRQYGREKLEQTGEHNRTCQQHLEYYLSLAEIADVKLRGPEVLEWYQILDLDEDNLRAALEWALGESQSIEQGLQLVYALNSYWYFWRGNNPEKVFYWIEKALACSQTLGRTALKAKTLFIAGWHPGVNSIMVRRQINDPRPFKLLEECLDIYRELGLAYCLDYARAQSVLALLFSYKGDYETARTHADQSVNTLRQIGDGWELAFGLDCAKDVFLNMGDQEAGRKMVEEEVALFRQVGALLWEAAVVAEILWWFSYNNGDYYDTLQQLDRGRSVLAEARTSYHLILNFLRTGAAWFMLQDYNQAEKFFQEGLREYAAVSSWAGIEIFSIEISLHLGYIALAKDNLQQAVLHFNEGVTISRKTNWNLEGLLCLAGIAALAATRGKSETAGRLYGAATVQLESLPLTVNIFGALTRQEFEHYQALARTQAGEAAFEVALQEGRGMTLEQAIELALGEVGTSSEC